MHKHLGYLLIIFVFACHEEHKTQVNPAHLNSLYEQSEVLPDMGIIRIYSEYPDYHWVWEKHEGIACVDDAARAAVFYLWHYQIEQDRQSLERAKSLFRFLIHMQSDNGYFFNFIFEDFQINKLYKRSMAVGDWWSWRCLWALSEAWKYFNTHDPEFTKNIGNAVRSGISAVQRDWPKEKSVSINGGFEQPNWLPGGSAGDQAAVLTVAMCNYFEVSSDSSITSHIRSLCDGMLMMQAGDETIFPHGAFLSWQNNWHGWGNLQSYAMLRAAALLQEDKYRRAALLEINHFAEYLADRKYAESFRFVKNDDKIVVEKEGKFPQIAYIIRPMVFAALEAYDQTGDTQYARKAGRIGAWLFGDNPAGVAMYDAKTGRCFDGIINEDEINRNSGAESTIEALLSLLVIERSEIAENTLRKEIQRLKN